MRLFLFFVLVVHVCRFVESVDPKASEEEMHAESLVANYRAGLVRKFSAMSSEVDRFTKLLVTFKDTHTLLRDKGVMKTLRARINGIVTDADLRKATIETVSINLQNEAQFPSNNFKGVNLLGTSVATLQHNIAFMKRSSDEVNQLLSSPEVDRLRKPVSELKEALDLQVKRVEALMEADNSLDSIKAYVTEFQDNVERNRQPKLREAQKQQRRLLRLQESPALGSNEEPMEQPLAAATEKKDLKQQDLQPQEQQQWETEPNVKEKQNLPHSEMDEPENLEENTQLDLQNQRKRVAAIAPVDEARAQLGEINAEGQQQIANESIQREEDLIVETESGEKRRVNAGYVEYVVDLPETESEQGAADEDEAIELKAAIGIGAELEAEVEGQFMIANKIQVGQEQMIPELPNDIAAKIKAAVAQPMVKKIEVPVDSEEFVILNIDVEEPADGDLGEEWSKIDQELPENDSSTS